MARVDAMRPRRQSRPRAATPTWRRPSAWVKLAAFAVACLATGRLPADELPGSLIFDVAPAPREVPASLPVISASCFSAEPPRFWSAGPDVQPQFVLIDYAPPGLVGSVPFGATQTIWGNGPSSLWTVLSRWEAGLWPPERPGIVRTASETPPTPLDDEGPLMPPQESLIAPAQAVASPLQSGSDLQPIDGSPCPPICPPLTFTDDAWAFLPRVAHDAWGVVNNWDNLIILGTALGGSLALRGDVDDDVRNWTAEHPDRWGHGTNLLGDFGTVQYQIPVIFGAYAFTVWEQDQWGHEMMTSLISAYTIFGLSTLTIKGIADTKRPSDGWNGGNYGFPSWHDGSLFCMSAVIDEYEGHWIGVPLYILSGLVGWSRIDARDHDLSDVVFGGVLGYVIGKSVAGRALYGDSRVVHIIPYVHPGEGTAGVMLDARF